METAAMVESGRLGRLEPLVATPTVRANTDEPLNSDQRILSLFLHGPRSNPRRCFQMVRLQTSPRCPPAKRPGVRTRSQETAKMSVPLLITTPTSRIARAAAGRQSADPVTRVLLWFRHLRMALRRPYVLRISNELRSYSVEAGSMRGIDATTRPPAVEYTG